LRGRYDDIRSRGGSLTVIGTGNVRYAKDFVTQERVPFPVLVDDDAAAARAASIRRAGLFDLFHPASYGASVRAWKDGYRVYWPGKRVNQLGATFVIAPGDEVRYAHYDAHPADHAPIEDVLAVLSGEA
jgi:peroxiredoxin